MALVDDKPRILDAIATVPDVKKALPAWPKTWAELPCVVVTEAGNQPIDYRDNKIQIVELEYYVRVFADRASEIAEISSVVDDKMVELGYERTMSWEDDSAEVRQKVLRYRAYF